MISAGAEQAQKRSGSDAGSGLFKFRLIIPCSSLVHEHSVRATSGVRILIFFNTYNFVCLVD